MTDKTPKTFVLRESWEYKSIIFIARFFVAGFVLIYALLTLPAIWSWAQVWYFRQQPPEHFAVLLKQAEKTGDFTHALRWVTARPKAEIDQHATEIESEAGLLPPMFFNLNIQAARLKHDEDAAAFWIAYRRYRQRFDLLRCGGPDAFRRGQDLERLMERFQTGPNEFAQETRDPQKLTGLLEKVLAFDAAHPAANDPRMTCQVIAQSLNVDYAPEPRENWEKIRFQLRLSTDQAVHTMPTAKKAAP